VRIDPDLVGAATEPYESAWTTRESMLYALAVGAGTADPAYTTDNTGGVEQRTLPTMPVLLTREARALRLLGDVDWTRLVHAEQELVVLAPLPVQGTAPVVSRIAALEDKGSAALITVTSESAGLFRSTSSFFVRGAGGFGGERRSRPSEPAPDGPPDRVVRQSTRPDQALLYRLCGDRNRLHSDPAIAARAGFDQPILHGLCTFGFAGRALLGTVCGGDPDRFGRIRVRFTAPVVPGDELTTEIWSTSDGAHFRTRRTDGRVVLDGGRLTGSPAPDLLP
jgi:acyl dehydratase